METRRLALAVLLAMAECTAGSNSGGGGGGVDPADFKTMLENSHPALTYNSPTYGIRQPTQVKVAVRIMHFFGVDDRSKTFRISGDLQVEWNDTRLAYDSGDASVDFESLSWDTGDLWEPLIYFQDAVEDFGEQHRYKLRSFSDGRVEKASAFNLKLLCGTMSFEHYPYDTQTCTIRLIPFEFDSAQVHVEFLYPAHTGFEDLSLGEWDNFSASTDTGTSEFYRFDKQIQSPYADVKFTMTRRTGSVMSTVLLPTVLVAVMSYSSYWINPAAAPARIALSMVCVLVAMSHRGSVLSRLPRVTYELWIDKYLLANLCFNFLAVVSYAFVNFGMQMRAAEQKQGEELRKKHDVEKAWGQGAEAAKPRARKPPGPGDDGGDDESDSDDGKSASAPKGLMAFKRAVRNPSLSLLVYVDHVMRVAFPLAYIIMNIVMFTSR